MFGLSREYFDSTRHEEDQGMSRYHEFVSIAAMDNLLNSICSYTCKKVAQFLLRLKIVMKDDNPMSQNLSIVEI